jgi:hypothetical protein
MVWRPFEGVFTLDAGMIVGSYAEGTPPADLAETQRDLAIHLGNHAAFNRDRLADRLRWFSVLLYAFIAEIVFLILTLIAVSRVTVMKAESPSPRPTAPQPSRPDPGMPEKKNQPPPPRPTERPGEKR